jgi:hypothetical protein
MDLYWRSGYEDCQDGFPSGGADRIYACPGRCGLGAVHSVKLKNILRHIMGADLITHLGLEYYD